MGYFAQTEINNFVLESLVRIIMYLLIKIINMYWSLIFKVKLGFKQFLLKIEPCEMQYYMCFIQTIHI